MHDYETALRLALQRSSDLVLRPLAGAPMDCWLNVELPAVRNRRLDLLGQTAEGDLIHIELQSRNDPDMPLRMAEYCLSVYRQFVRFPRQILLYVGQETLI